LFNAHIEFFTELPVREDADRCRRQNDEAEVSDVQAPEEA